MRIVTDSAADLTAEEAAALGVRVAPLFIQFPGEEVDAGKIAVDLFYERLAAMRPALPTTAQPSSGLFAQMYREYLPKWSCTMEKRKIFITEQDMERLRKLLPETRPGAAAMPAHLQDLAGELDRAEVLAATEVPPHVITMNSRVRLHDLDTGEKEVYTLVFPENADVDRGRISVLAPVGTGMLGYGLGDVIEWPVPAGMRRLRVEEVLYQPEAAGDYEL